MMLVDGVGAGVEQAVDRVLLVLLLLGNLRLHHIYHTCGCQCFRRIKRLCSFSAFVLVILYTVTLVHGYFDSGWRPGTGGQIQYISIEKVCQNIEN